MFTEECGPTRRGVLKTGLALAAGFSSSGTPALAAGPEDTGVTIVGPKPGFSPEIGTLASMMAFMRRQVLRSVEKLGPQDLDFLLDAKANRIGALLMHLAATEAYYQLNTFQNVKWGDWPDAAKQKWDVPSKLGEPARKSLVGKSVGYYVDMLTETREKTLAEFRKRDDKWLMVVDKDWPWGPTNNYCKWFHVTEHEANHNGQIKLLKSRLPGAKPADE